MKRLPTHCKQQQQQQQQQQKQKQKAKAKKATIQTLPKEMVFF